jgi:UDP-2,3-diacylglucosamine hydrolase
MRRTKSRTKRKAVPRHKTYFISDAHLGFGLPEEDRERELRLIHFLDSIQRDAEQLFIVGDLFDFWFEYKTVVPKKYFRLFAKLAELAEKGIHLFFIAGNHDFWIKDYFQNELGMAVSLNPVETEIHGKRFLIHHGDGLLKDDIGYKILKKILRNRVNIFLFSLLHPDFTGWIARWSSQTSRRYTSNRTYESSGMVEYAAQKIQEGFDFIVMGHNHVPSQQKVGKGVYINLGDWIYENTYAVYNKGTLELKKWKD